MNRIISTAIIVSLSSILTSCGGGGGGGGNSGVRLLHSAIDATPVNFTSSGNTNPLGTVAFGDTPQYESVPKGAQTIGATLLGNNGVTVGTSVDYEGGAKSVLLYEANGDQDYTLAVVDDGAADIPSGQAAVRVVDGVGKARQLDLRINGTAVTGGVAQGGATAYTNVPGGTVTLTAVVEGRTIFSGAFTVTAGSAYSMLLIGEDGYLVLGRLLGD